MGISAFRTGDHTLSPALKGCILMGAVVLVGGRRRDHVALVIQNDLHADVGQLLGLGKPVGKVLLRIGQDAVDGISQIGRASCRERV